MGLSMYNTAESMQALKARMMAISSAAGGATSNSVDA
jgi:hypothetical protein